MIRLCPSFTGYAATDDGRVLSHRKRGARILGQRGGTRSVISESPQLELKQATTLKGYRTVSIVFSKEKARPVGVHQLVADAFLGPVPEGMEVRHLDGNPSNNEPANLCYGTSKDNAADRLRHGRYASGSRHANAKLTSEQVKSVLSLRRLGIRIKAIAAKHGVSVSTIESIVYGKSYVTEQVAESLPADGLHR